LLACSLKTKLETKMENKTLTVTNRHNRAYVVQAMPTGKPHTVFDRCTGIYQVNNLRMLRDLKPDARRIIDVGANIGINTIEYATWAQHVEAFECNNFTFELLQHNVEANRNRRCPVGWYKTNNNMDLTAEINFYNVALMERNATAFVQHNQAGLSDYVTYTTGPQQCSTRTIDSYNFTDVDVIKLDTEGTEWLILQGADATLRRCRPVVQVEMWAWERRFGLNNQHMLDYFRSLNYRQVDSAGRNMPWDFAGRITKAYSVEHFGSTKSAMDRFFIPA
jgi:FkbM family methyltransferase